MSEMTGELAVHLAAAAHQANAAALTDSAQFMAGVEALHPDTPGFVARVADAVADAVRSDRERFGVPGPVEPVEQSPAAPPSRETLTASYDGPITAEDVQRAPVSVVGAWVAAGKLTHLGVPPARRRGR